MLDAPTLAATGGSGSGPQDEGGHALRRGDSLHPFVIIDELGRGAMGTVSLFRVTFRVTFRVRHGAPVPQPAPPMYKAHQATAIHSGRKRSFQAAMPTTKHSGSVKKGSTMPIQFQATRALRNGSHSCVPYEVNASSNACVEWPAVVAARMRTRFAFGLRRMNGKPEMTPPTGTKARLCVKWRCYVHATSVVITTADEDVQIHNHPPKRAVQPRLRTQLFLKRELRRRGPKGALSHRVHGRQHAAHLRRGQRNRLNQLIAALGTTRRRP